jgi:hypothetical protein
VTYEERIEKRWQVYRDMVEAAAQAISEYDRLDAMTKPIKARLMQDAAETGITSVAGQEREAYAAKQYTDHIAKVAESRFKMEMARGELQLMRDKIDWARTRRADRRAELQLR